MAEKAPCPTCGRTVTVQANRTVRRHKPAASPVPFGPDDDRPAVVVDAEGWCPGGVVPAPGDAKVIQLGTTRRRGGPRQAHGMTDQEKADANAKRPESRKLDRNGNGACGARKTDKAGKVGETRCTNARGQGTDHLGYGRCKHHGGSSPTGKKHAALEQARAEVEKFRRAQMFYGRRVAIDPEQALLEEMQRSAGVVRWLEQAISSWGEFERFAAELAALDPAPDDRADPLEEMLDQLQERGRRILDGEAITEGVQFHEGATGLPTLVAVHSTEKALGFTDTEYRAWLKVYQEERRHLAQVAKACIEANIAERRQQVLEARGEMIRRLVLLALKLAGVTMEEPAALEIVAEATRTVARELPA